MFSFKKIDILMKSGSFKPLELTAEFGTKLMNFLRELNNMNVTFHLQKHSASGKADLSSLQNVHFFKNYKKKKDPRGEDTFDYAIEIFRHSESECWL